MLVVGSYDMGGGPPSLYSLDKALTLAMAGQRAATMVGRDVWICCNHFVCRKLRNKIYYIAALYVLSPPLLAAVTDRQANLANLAKTV